MFDFLPFLPSLPSLPSIPFFPSDPFQPFKPIFGSGFDPIQNIGDLINPGEIYEGGKKVIGDIQGIIGDGIVTGTSSIRRGIFGDLFGNLTLPAIVLVIIVLGLGAMIIF